MTTGRGLGVATALAAMSSALAGEWAAYEVEAFPSGSSELASEDLTESVGEGAAVELRLGRGEHGYAALAVLETDGTTLELRFGLTELVADDVAASLEPTSTTLRVAAERSFDGGPVADALVRAEGRWTIGPHDVLLLWLEVAVPTDAEPGTYLGAVVVEETGVDTPSLPTELPVSIEVGRFTLPATTSTGLAMADYAYAVPEGHPREPGELDAELAEIRLTYGNTAVLSYRAPELVETADGYTLDDGQIEILDLELRRHDPEGLRPVVLFLGPASPKGYCGEREIWEERYAAWIERISDRVIGDASDRFVLYPLDEPNPGRPYECDGVDRYEVFVASAEIIRSVAPQLRIFYNFNARESDRPDLEALTSLVDVWVPYDLYGLVYGAPLYDAEELEFLVERQHDGAEVWTYLSTGIGQRVDRLREVFWHLWAGDGDGFLTWSLYGPKGRVADDGTRVPTSPWTAEPGEGSFLIYLASEHDPDAPEWLSPDEAIVPSRRLAARRRGFEDHRRLVRLAERLTDVDPTDPDRPDLEGLVAEVLADERTLDAATETLFDWLERWDSP